MLIPEQGVLQIALLFKGDTLASWSINVNLVAQPQLEPVPVPPASS
jgi:hypothetical protein